MCLGALATQTGGSITRPASYCGVYSIKPTYDRVSVDGVLPLAPSMDHVGAMANCVRDLAILFQVIAGPDRRRGFTFPGHTPIPDALAAIDRNATDVADPEFCVLGGLFDELLGSEVRPLYSTLLGRLEGQISLLDKKVPPAGYSEVLKLHRIVMAVEAAHFHGDRLRRRQDDYPPRIRGLIEEGLGYPSVAYRTALTLAQELSDQLTRSLNGQRYYMTPATVDPAPDASITGNPAFNSPWSFTGHPTLSLPYVFTSTGLPLAVQLIGSPMCEDDLYAAAEWLERAIGFERRALPL
jgi:aspartyl-tRNA(Asn)/glutamyl-tRNA(Gln) amidotransferase subunit A